MKELERVSHTLEPIFDKSSKILILGTIPSPKSREAGFYYGHPQNRFWRVLSAVLREETPETGEKKRAMLLRNNIALWDVLQSCDITGASDSSIKNPTPNDIGALLRVTDISAVFTTGQTAYRLFMKLLSHTIPIAPQLLPSPSPANCAVSFERLKEEYSVILKPLSER